MGDLPGVFVCFDDPNHRATADADVGRRLVSQAGLNRLEALTGDLYRLAVLARCEHSACVGFEHHRRQQVAIVGVLLQGFINGLLELLSASRQGGKFFRPPVDLAAFKIHDAAAQRFVSHILLVGAQCGVNIQTPGVGVLAVLGKHELAHRLGDKLGVYPAVVGVGLDFELLLFGRGRLLRIDETVFQHALNDVQLTRAGPFRVGNRVVG